MPSCAIHPEFEAKSRCARCDRAMCAACERLLNGRPYCADCQAELERKLAERRATAAPPAPAASTAGSSPPLPELYDPAAGPVPPPPAPVPPPPPAPLGPEPGLLRPLALALVAGILGALVWYLSVRYSDYKLGLVAVGVGWLVGKAAVLGAGGRGSGPLAIGSVVVALGAMLFGEYMIVNHFAHLAFAAEMPEVELPAYFGLSEFFAIYSETIGIMDVVFYAIGAYEAWKLPAAASH